MAKESVDTLCLKAKAALAEGNNDQARQHYLAALALRSDVPDVHYGLATVCFLLNDLPSAAYHFKEVTRLDPLRAGAFINLGAIYNRLDQLDEAVPALRRGIQLDMNRAEGYYNLGLVYRRKGQIDLAIQAYREAVRVNPRMADAHFNLGNLYLEKEQLALAVAHYRQALELRPSWEKARNGLENAQQALHAQEVPAPEPQPPPTAPPPGKAAAGKGNPERQVDPLIHGTLLAGMHKAVAEAEVRGRDFAKLIESEVEAAIKDLSSCLLYPDSSLTEIDHFLGKFESALSRLLAARETVQQSLDKVRTAGDHLLQA